MKWPTWEHAAIAAVISGLLALAARRGRTGRARFVEQASIEFALLSALYAVWRVARKLPLAQDEGAIERARQIVDVQNALHFPTELSLQQFVLRHDWLGWPTTLYYATLHVPALLAFLVWLFVRHREHYAHWRNGLAILTAACLVIRFVRVAPPRFLVDLGYEDLSEIYGPSIYGPVGTGVSDQFAAMPSIHVGWAAVVSFGIVAVSTSRWRWLFMLHVVITMIVVSASGNHWWLDGIVAIALLWAGLAIDTAVRRRVAPAEIVEPPVEPVALTVQSSTSSGGDGSTIS
ncbi:MAG: phosphatase PAP2 family protein [Ilumatobacter sp.]|nr:phosphatase PAP2 family protein [Ilumatobacter sp.]